MTTMTLLVLFAYFLCLLVITWHTARKEKSSDFIIGSRNVGLGQTAISQLVSSYDGTGLVIFLMFSVMFGYGLLWMGLGIALGTLLFAFFAPRIHKLAKEEAFVTLSDMFRERIGYNTENLNTLLVLFVTWFSTAGQIYVAGSIMSVVLVIPTTVSIFIITAIIMIYMLAGGYAAVIKTDIIQGISIFLVLAVAYLFGQYTLPIDMLSQAIHTEPEMLWGFLLWGFFYGTCNAYMWQRTFSAGSSAVAQKAPLINIPLNLVVMVGMILFAHMITARFPSIQAGSMIEGIFSTPDMIPVVGPLIALAFMALLMSSVDSYMTLFSSTVVSNIFRINEKTEEKRFVHLSRITLAVGFILLALMASLISDFIQYMVNTLSVLFIYAGTLLASLYLKHKSKMADRLISSGQIICCLLWIFMFWHGLFDTLLMNTIPAGVSIAFAGTAIWYCNRRAKTVQKI